MFFINENKSKYVSVGFYPARDYQTLVEFDAIQRAGSKSLILIDKQFATLTDYLLRYAIPSVSAGHASSNVSVSTFDYKRRRGRGRPECLSEWST